MALVDIVKKGSTDRSVPVYVFDNTTGLPISDRAYNSTGIDLWYRREGAAKTSITEATLAALTTAHADGGFLTVGDGEYRLDLPDAAFATGANYVDYGGTFTGYTVVGGRVRLVDVDLEDTIRAGLTALPAVASGAAGAIITSGTGTAQLSTSSGQTLVQSGTGTGQISLSSGRAAANVTYWNGTAVPAENTAGYPIVTIKDGTGTGEINTSAGTVSLTDASITGSTFSSGAISSAVLATTAVDEIVAGIKAMIVETNNSRTLGETLSIILAACAGVTSSAGSVLKDPSGTSTRITATINGSNERTAMTLTPSA
jgi:hypothetical protein